MLLLFIFFLFYFNFILVYIGFFFSFKVSRARVIKAIKDIHVGDKDWTAKVILIEKGMPRYAKSSPTKFQMLAFADTEVIYHFFFLDCFY